MGTGSRRRRSQREAAQERGRRDPLRARILRGRRPELILVLAALALRLVYLVQSADIPSFAMPLVDSEVYDRAARALAAGDGLGEPFFFQPFLYPFVLGLIYLFTNGSIVAAKLMQAVLGAATCGLVADLGARVADRRTGLVAGWITAVCGPLIFFESELLAAGWAAFFSVLLVRLLLAARDAPSPRRLLGLGVTAGLALITRPTFLPFVVVAGVWLAATLWRRHGPTPALRWFAAAVAGTALVVVPVAGAARAVTGEAHALPASGGLNLHLGNNPEPCATLTIRPGQQWHELVTAPMAAGAESLWQQDRYFTDTAEHDRRNWRLLSLNTKGLSKADATIELRQVLPVIYDGLREVAPQIQSIADEVAQLRPGEEFPVTGLGRIAQRGRFAA